MTTNGTMPKLDAAEPHNSDAEVAILGAILDNNAIFERFDGTLAASDFYVGFHADLYDAMARLIADDRRADLVTLAPTYRGKKVHEIDAEDYVRGLPEYAPATPEELRDYAHEVLRFSAQRGVMAAARALWGQAARRDVKLIEAYDAAAKEFDAALARAQQREQTLRPIHEFLAIARDAAVSGAKGVQMGLARLDRMTGGLFPGDLSIVGGRTSMGKTTFASEIALNVARSRRGALFLSLEMQGSAVAPRVASSVLYRSDDDCLPYSRFRTGFQRGDVERVREAEAQLASVPLLIDQKPALSMAQINSIARGVQSHFEARGTPLALIVVDYLGLIELSTRWGDNRAYAIGTATTGLKELAKRLDVHVMALHQLNREVEREQDKRPQVHHLRESGSIEQDADLVMLCYRPEYYIEREGVLSDPVKEQDRQTRLAAVRNKMEIIVPKNRQGEVGTRTFFCSVANSKVADDGDFAY